MFYLKMRRTLYVVLIFVLGVSATLKAQNQAFFREFPKLNRDINQSIYDLFVVDKGLLYLGTSLGLFSFNGVEVNSYDFKSNLSFSVDNVEQSYDGKIWCKNFSNEIFFLEGGKLQKDITLDNYFLSNDSYLLDFKFVDKAMYILLEHQFLKYDMQTHQISELLSAEVEKMVFHSFDYNSLTSEFVIASDDEVITLKNDKIFEVTKHKKGAKKVYTYFKDVFLINKNSQQIFKNEELLYVPKNGTSNIVFHRFSELNTQLWLASSSGLFNYDTKTNSITNFGLKAYNVTDIVTDLEGNYWVSTLDDGVFFMPNINLKRLKVFDDTPTENFQNFSTLTSNSKNEFYAGTSHGKVLKFNSNNEVISIFDTKTNLEIEYVFEDEEKLITSRGYFDLLNNNSFKECYMGKSIAKDHIGNYLLSTYNLAGILNSNLKGSPNTFNTNLINFGNLNANIHVLRKKRSRSSYYSNFSNQYYVGYSDGLYVYNSGLFPQQIKHGQNEIIAMSIQEDTNADLWIATNRNGILKVKDDKIIDSISTKNGLSNNKTKTIKIHDDKAWILTQTNLDVYDIHHKKVLNIGNRLGLNGLILNDILIVDNYLYIATNRGILYISLIDLEQPINPYFKVNISGTSSSTNHPLEFAHNDNIKIQFESIFYKSFGDFSYRFKLTPLQDEWQLQKAENNELNLFSLPPGIYNLEAQIADQSIIDSSQTLTFRVLKPFWLQWWFTSISLLILLLIFVLIYKFAVYKTQKRQNLREELATSQLTALRSQMNPHFIFNVLNSIQGLMYSNQKGKANDYMGKFSELMRNILDNSEKRYISLEDELHTMKLYIELEKSRFEDDEFLYQVNIDSQINSSEIEIPSMIIQPFVENAIKHGLMHKRGQKQLDINFLLLSPSILRVEIKDNGVGLKLSKEINKKIKKHKSFATKAIEKRIDLMNKLSQSSISIQMIDLSDEHQHTHGTLIRIDIPLRHIQH